MIDIHLLRENPQTIENSLTQRGISINIQEIVSLDQTIRKKKYDCEQKKHERKKVSGNIGKGNLNPTQKQQTIEKTRILGEEIKKEDSIIRTLEEKLNYELLCIPNLLHPDTPFGKSEKDNVNIREYGSIPTFSFVPQHHATLAENLDIIDTPRGVKVSQSRFTVLKKAGALLERALANFMLDIQVTEHGYTELMTPYLVNRNSMIGTGQLPKFEEDAFQTSDDLFLIPTAEVSLTNIHREEILKESDLPIKYTAWTPCFRREAGSYGKDTKGYIRQHQFHKVELVQLVHPRNSLECLEQLTQHAETILQKLELPYRVMALCSQDIGFGAGKCYDIEVWLPSENQYREISSCSNTFDFQARRANIRFKPTEGGKPQYVHTLNGSGLAIGRTLIAILENFQQEDGSILIPKILQPYTRGLTKIK